MSCNDCEEDCTECSEEGASKEEEDKINKALVNRLTEKDKDKERLFYIR